MTAPGLRWRAGTELVAVLTLVLALVTVGSNRPAEARATRFSQAAAPESRGTVVTGSMRWDGVSRTYRVFVPTSYTAGTPTPLVVGLHGGFGSGRQFERDNGLEPALAERAMLGVFPDGVAGPLTGIRTWNAGNCCAYSMNADVDDVGFIDALVKRLRRRYTVDPARIYAIGHSNGGMLSFRLGCDLPGVFAAIAPVAGAVDDTRRCQPGHRLNVLVIHGYRDRNVPYAGGIGAGYSQVDYASVADAMTRWRRINRCGPDSIVTRDGDLRTTDATGCAAGGDLRLRTLLDGNHEWPGGADRAFIAGSPSDALDATADALDFFLAHPATP